jgi:hypothetical protein
MCCFGRAIALGKRNPDLLLRRPTLRRSFEMMLHCCEVAILEPDVASLDTRPWSYQFSETGLTDGLNKVTVRQALENLANTVVEPVRTRCQ